MRISWLEEDSICFDMIAKYWHKGFKKSMYIAPIIGEHGFKISW
jgi:hypothetical protein